MPCSSAALKVLLSDLSLLQKVFSSQMSTLLGQVGCHLPWELRRWKCNEKGAVIAGRDAVDYHVFVSLGWPSSGRAPPDTRGCLAVLGHSGSARGLICIDMFSKTGYCYRLVPNYCNYFFFQSRHLRFANSCRLSGFLKLYLKIIALGLRKAQISLN